MIGANGALTGFSGGLAAKRFLLRLESALPGAVPDDLLRQRRWRYSRPGLSGPGASASRPPASMADERSQRRRMARSQGSE